MRRSKWWAIRLGIVVLAAIVLLVVRLDRSTLTQVRSLTGHAKGILHLQFSADGRWLASAGLDKTAHLWEVATGKEIATLPHPAAVTGLVIHPAGEWCATASDGRIRVWSLPDVKLLRELDRPQPVRALSLSGDGGYLMCGEGTREFKLEGETAEQGAMEVLDTKTWEPIFPAREFSHPISAVAIAPSGSRLAFKEQSKEHRLYIERIDGAERGRIAPVREEELTWSPDGRLLLTGGARMWHWDGERLTEGPPLPVATFSNSGAFTPDGARFVSAGSAHSLTNLCLHGVAVLIDPAANRVVGRAVVGDSFGFSPQNKETLYCAAFSPDGTLLATGSDDGRLQLWKVPPK